MINAINKSAVSIIHLAVFFIPISFFISIKDIPLNIDMEFRISISDLLILSGSVIFIFSSLILNRSIKEFAINKWLTYFIIAISLSIVNTKAPASFIKEFIQFFIAFYIWYLLLEKFSSTNKSYHSLINTLILACTMTILIALYQSYIDTQKPFFIRGTFANRNTYGVYIACILPLLLSKLHESSSYFRKLACFLILVGGLLSIQAVGHLISAIIGILLTSLFYEKKTTLIVSLGILITTVALFTVPSNDRNNEFKRFISIQEIDDVKNNIRNVWSYNSAIRQGQFCEYYFGSTQISLFHDLLIPKEITQQPKHNNSIKEEQHPILKQYYAEWIAALNLIAEKPFTGCGLGNYQNSIGSYYGNKPKNNTSEPNFRNGYLVLAGSTGFLGLFVFLLILIRTLIKLHKCLAVNKTTTLIPGVFGSTFTLILANFYTPIFISQLGLLTVLIIFIAVKLTDQSNA